ncbi:MAG: FtsW/RodA/SpoVE family cell cycle protein [Clostridiales bacterium]|nr:FtsW/RodA/SpoVE family cell cycle protein [Clostridiales bacterium]MBS5877442.1 FtsW/RodA/SpoVE family cell cycle protein [Clostridiales bacterium]MDU0938829.1 FtsW/RodA/SpoVE family cell cycle protein [Clostridiales bacterium]MDU1041531.1 FtsW/RodA/SpoVE family cell cycle protein [Clostridiales bacterium]MDU3489822.1 FtsW/RodA/SpoVE family cell cycle protein [Clostridiales bacterium]
MDFIEISRYIFVGLISIYTLVSFVGATLRDNRALKGVYAVQNIATFVIHLLAYIILYINTNDLKYMILYACEFALLFVTIVVYDVVYPKASRLLVNNMILLEAIGFIMIARMNYSEAVRQLVLGIIGTVITFFVPAILRKVKKIRDWGWIYAIVGFILLVLVLFGGKEYGANIALRIGSFRLQPSEFVKILIILFIASLYNKRRDFKQIMIVSGVAAAHVMVLIVSNDLGTALIMFVTYLMMIYVATKKPLLLVAGGGVGAVAALLANKFVPHVTNRIAIWKNPWDKVNTSGYQIAQSLFALAAGGWIGVGLTKGRPNLIPFVEKDMVFSAITEEMGAIFSIAIILICLNNLLLMMNIASRCNTLFYRLVAVGLGTTYAFQVFLTIGGAIKLIPLTGVTLPFVSYGGSSLISSLIMFGLINGMYTMRHE